MNDRILDQFPLSIQVTIRLAEAADLPHLEWYGMFTPHREHIEDAFERQRRGEVAMLVADVGGWPAAQIWIDLAKYRDESAGMLWAMRVIPVLHNRGIGTRLIHAAECLLRQRGYLLSEVGVEIQNLNARRLYERLGYRELGRIQDEYFIMMPEAGQVTIPIDMWVMRKRLDRPALPEEEEVKEDPCES